MSLNDSNYSPAEIKEIIKRYYYPPEKIKVPAGYKLGPFREPKEDDLYLSTFGLVARHDPDETPIFGKRLILEEVFEDLLQAAKNPVYTAEDLKRKFGEDVLQFILGHYLYFNLREHPGFSYTGDFRMVKPGEWYLSPTSGCPNQAPAIGMTGVYLIMRKEPVPAEKFPVKAVFVRTSLEETDDGELLFARSKDGLFREWDPDFDSDTNLYTRMETY